MLVDRPGNPARFLVLGSAGPDLLRQSSETLADLRLDRLFVVVPGALRFPLHERVEAVGLERACADGLQPRSAGR